MRRLLERRNRDIARVVILSCLLPAAIFLLPGWASPLRVLLGFLFALVIPGYALGVALFPAPDDLDELERLALTLGLSVAVIPLIGLLINYSRWSLDATSIALGVVIVSLAGAAAGLLRRSQSVLREAVEVRTVAFGTEQALDHKAPRVAGGRRQGSPVAVRETERPTTGRLGALEVLAVVAIAWILVVITAETIRPPSQATEFYVLGDSGTLEAYPQHLRAGEPFELTVAVTNHEGKRESFRVRTSLAGSTSVFTVPALDNRETWVETIELRAPASEGRSSLQLELFRSSDVDWYRSLRLWLLITEAPAPRLPSGIRD